MYTQVDLPYNYADLEPYIDTQTMELHYTKHHATYLEKLNSALASHAEYSELPLEQLLQSLDKLPEDIKTVVRNSGGGVYNHDLFWQMMTPEKNTNMSSGLEEVLAISFGTLDKFKEEFTSKALGLFGSGWVWLVKDRENKLVLSQTQNQDSPIMQGMKPILGIDVWEHAYYLKYQNRRAEYISNWWNVVNWEYVEEQLVK